jgi:hypothetical protein
MWLRLNRFACVVVVGISALVAACSAPLGIGQTSTADLINTANSELDSAKSFEVSGRFSDAGKKYTMDLQLRRPSSVHLTMTINGVGLEAIEVGPKAYYRGADFLAQAAGPAAGSPTGPRLVKAVGDRWWTASEKPAPDLSGLTDNQKLKANFLNSLLVNRKEHVTVSGLDTVELSGKDGTVNISDTTPHRLVRVQVPSGMTVDGYTDADLRFSNYGKDFSITAPSGVLDFSDPSTLPPLYDVLSVDSSGCRSASSCVVAATVKNRTGLAGAPAQSTVTFNLSDSGGKSIGTCSAGIAPDVANGATTTVSCKVPLGGFSGAFTVHATPSNPAYD